MEAKKGVRPPSSAQHTFEWFMYIAGACAHRYLAGNDDDQLTGGMGWVYVLFVLELYVVSFVYGS